MTKPVKSNDSANASKIIRWDPVDEYPSVYARKKELPGKELVEADRLTYVQTTIWTIAHRTDLTTENRVVFNSKPYEIISITENGRGRYLDIHANLIDTETWSFPEGAFSSAYSSAYDS